MQKGRKVGILGTHFYKGEHIMQEEKEKVHRIYQQYESLIDAYDNILRANHAVLLTKYMTQREESITQKLTKAMLTCASVIFLSCSNEELDKIGYYYENRFEVILPCFAMKYFEDLGIQRLDQLKAHIMKELRHARELSLAPQCKNTERADDEQERG